MSDKLDGIPAPLLCGAFSHARAVHQILKEFAEEHGFVGHPSYKQIKPELDYLKSDLEQVGELVSELPKTIRVELEAVAVIVNEALCNISFADVCQSFLESDLETHGKRGWREVIRLSDPPAIGWAKPASPALSPAEFAESMKPSRVLSQAAIGDVADKPLSGNKQDILQWLLESNATNSDNRKIASDIAIGVAGTTADVNAFKEPLASLVSETLLSSKTGRGGGYWLTETGIDRANKQ